MIRFSWQSRESCVSKVWLISKVGPGSIRTPSLLMKLQPLKSPCRLADCVSGAQNPDVVVKALRPIWKGIFTGTQTVHLSYCLCLFFTNCASKRFFPCTRSPRPPAPGMGILGTSLLLYRRALPVKGFCLASKIRTHLRGRPGMDFFVQVADRPWVGQDRQACTDPEALVCHPSPGPSSCISPSSLPFCTWKCPALSVANRACLGLRVFIPRRC